MPFRRHVARATLMAPESAIYGPGPDYGPGPYVPFTSWGWGVGVAGSERDSDAASPSLDLPPAARLRPPRRLRAATRVASANRRKVPARQRPQGGVGEAEQHARRRARPQRDRAEPDAASPLNKTGAAFSRPAPRAAAGWSLSRLRGLGGVRPSVAEPDAALGSIMPEATVALVKRSIRMKPPESRLSR